MSNEITTPDDIEPSAISANTLRMLAADAVQKANSGHPGAPMGMAEMAVTLWQRHLKHNPNDPQWADRDRFVLSNGHASMLIYSLLHLSGYDLPMEELKNFRQLHSKTPGHPEVDVTRASRRRPALWVRAWRMRSVWPWQRSCWPTSLIVPAMKLSTTVPGFSSVTAV